MRRRGQIARVLLVGVALFSPDRLAWGQGTERAAVTGEWINAIPCSALAPNAVRSQPWATGSHAPYGVPLAEWTLQDFEAFAERFDTCAAAAGTNPGQVRSIHVLLGIHRRGAEARARQEADRARQAEWQAYAAQRREQMEQERAERRERVEQERARRAEEQSAQQRAAAEERVRRADAERQRAAERAAAEEERARMAGAEAQLARERADAEERTRRAEMERRMARQRLEADERRAEQARAEAHAARQHPQPRAEAPATQAQNAEAAVVQPVRDLARLGDWTIVGGIEEGNRTCGAFASFGEGRRFFLKDTVLPDGSHENLIELRRASWNIPYNSEIRLRVQVGSAPPWDATGLAEGDRAIVEIPTAVLSQGFAVPLQANQTVLLSFSGITEPDWHLDLDGVVPAMAAALLCLASIDAQGNVPASAVQQMPSLSQPTAPGATGEQPPAQPLPPVTQQAQARPPAPLPPPANAAVATCRQPGVLATLMNLYRQQDPAATMLQARLRPETVGGRMRPDGILSCAVELTAESPFSSMAGGGAAAQEAGRQGGQLMPGFEQLFRPVLLTLRYLVEDMGSQLQVTLLPDNDPRR